MVPPSVEVHCQNTYSASTIIFSNNNKSVNDDDSIATSTPSCIVALSPSDYSQLFSLHDIPTRYHPKLSMSLKSFSGKWRLMLKRSDSIDAIMKALGVGILKRRVMSSYSPVSEFIVSKECSTLRITSHLPLGVVKTTVISFNKHEIQEHQDETGNWKSQGFFHEGRILQRRDKPGGVMYDMRGVFEKDPIDDNNRSMVMLFVWTYVTDEGDTFSVNRWLEKIE